MTTARRRYVEPFLGGGAVLLGMLQASEPTNPSATPFLRWAGGKRKLYPEIVKRFGDVSVVDSYLVADVNADLVAAWQAVRNDVEQVAMYLRLYAKTKEMYYAERDECYPGDMVASCGARMIFLNLYSFNGLWRTNKSGDYNVPCDPSRFAKVDIEAVISNLRAVSPILQQRTGILCQDFATTLSGCGDGDIIYCDPPYIGTFTGYSSGGFDEAKQLLLAYSIRMAVERGARVVISNSEAARPIYDHVLAKLPGYRVDVVQARRSVSCKGDGRGVVDEILVSVG
jgi:DNA adenine methylase